MTVLSLGISLSTVMWGGYNNGNNINIITYLNACLRISISLCKVSSYDEKGPAVIEFWKNYTNTRRHIFSFSISRIYF